LLVGYRELLGFLFLMSLCGGALALAALTAKKLDRTARRFRPAACFPSVAETTRDRAVPEEPTVPYGVAVATAGVITLLAGR
jgi:Flp pilus assembly protein protease CpaA